MDSTNLQFPRKKLHPDSTSTKLLCFQRNNLTDRKSPSFLSHFANDVGVKCQVVVELGPQAFESTTSIDLAVPEVRMGTPGHQSSRCPVRPLKLFTVYCVIVWFRMLCLSL